MPTSKNSTDKNSTERVISSVLWRSASIIKGDQVKLEKSK